MHRTATSRTRRPAPVQHSIRPAQLDALEPRRHLAVNFAIDATADVRPISRYVYGVNQPLTGALANATFTRLGGNRWTAYNWENNASNAGSDYLFQNDGYLSQSDVPGAAVTPTIQNAVARNAATMLTVPIAGYASADKNGGGDVRNSGANYLSTRFNQVVARKPGGNLSLTPNAADDFVYTDEFVNWVMQTYPQAATNPNTPIWFSLDNEPDLWSDTHAAIHPQKVTYAELIQKSVAHASAIKETMPGTKVFGAANYGFGGYVSLQNAPDANGRDFLEFYLAQMKAASQQANQRLLDVLDLHWYPEARGGGTRITFEGNGNAPAVVEARLQAPRSLWDASYRETSWIANDVLRGPINLLPRLQAKIDAQYPGTALGFSEYNYGGGDHISGGIAQADVLGIFGRSGVFSANQWQIGASEPFVAAAFRMFRDYDGAGAAFGDTSVRATRNDVAGASVYASLDSANPNVMTIVAINKTANANVANVSLAGRSASGAAKVYTLTGANAAPQAGADLNVSGASFAYAMPAYSVTTIRVPLAGAVVAPRVTGQSFRYEASPNALTYTFDRDVSASLQASDLTVTRGGASVAPTAVSYDAATNTATFAMPANLPDGVYTATLSGSGVSAGGVALGANVTQEFHVLLGDANRDRRVDFADLLVLARSYGQPGRSFSQGNFDYSGDGVVNFDDLLILARRYGTTLLG